MKRNPYIGYGSDLFWRLWGSDIGMYAYISSKYEEGSEKLWNAWFKDLLKFHLLVYIMIFKTIRIISQKCVNWYSSFEK